MKKILAIAVLGTLAMASCSKDYSCTCTYDSTTTGGGNSTSNTSTNSYEVNEASSDEATAACNGASVVTRDTNEISGTQYITVNTSSCELSK